MVSVLEIGVLGSPKAHPHEEPHKHVTFMLLELTPTSEAPLSASAPSAPSEPQWVGSWKLDKARSDKYEPVFADMGVNVLIRKMADAQTSIMDISKSDTHITLLLKSVVSFEESMPLDGSWMSKPVPRGSKMRGMCRCRLTKYTDSEVEMYTEFPEGWGELRDTLTVADDGQSFSRRIARSDTLAITRYFMLEPRGL